jgi:hypothetical protein
MHLAPLPDDDLIGENIGKLTVIGKFRQIYGNGKTQLKYACICDCNTDHTIYVKRDDLIHNRRLHCGCLRKEPANKYKDRTQAMLRHHYNSSIVKRSRQKKFIEIIDFEDFISYIQQPCVFCGTVNSCTLKDRHPHKGAAEQIKCNTIDRLDNSLGYIVGNCVPCCVTCNIAKGERTLEQFTQWIQNVYQTIVHDLGGKTDVSL